MADSGQQRRIPKQARSLRRLEQIVAAAAQRFATIGFEATTMEAIAADAETSIGSVYQFFPNKLAVFQAIAERCLSRSAEFYTEVLASTPSGAGWQEHLDLFLDGFARFHDSDPYLQAMLANVQLYGEYEEADAALMEQFIAVTDQMMSSWAPKLPAERRARLARMVVTTMGLILFQAARGEPAIRPALIEEVRTMLHRYLEPELGRVES